MRMFSNNSTKMSFPEYSDGKNGRMFNNSNSQLTLHANTVCISPDKNYVCLLSPVLHLKFGLQKKTC